MSQNHTIEEMERVILGNLLSGRIKVLEVSSILEVEDFISSTHQAIYRSILVVNSNHNTFNILLVHHDLTNTKTKEITVDHLVQLSKDQSTISDVKKYVMVIKERSLTRLLAKVGKIIHDEATNSPGKGLIKLLTNSETYVGDVRGKSIQVVPIVSNGEVLKGMIENFKKNKDLNIKLIGISSGFSALDDVTLGFNGGDLIVVAGRPGMGKTAFAMNIVEHVCLTKNKLVLVFSMEMSRPQILMRMLGSVSGVNLSLLKTGTLNKSQWERVNGVVDQLSTAPLVIEDGNSFTSTDIVASIRSAVVRDGKPSLIVIDYIQLIPSTSSPGNRVAEITEISKTLKQIAKEFDVPVIVISQLNRGLELRPDKRPMLSDLRESGAIEQDADLILFIHREEVYEKTAGNKGLAKIIIGKHRNGPTAEITLRFNGGCTRFEEIPGKTKV